MLLIKHQGYIYRKTSTVITTVTFDIQTPFQRYHFATCIWNMRFLGQILATHVYLLISNKSLYTCIISKILTFWLRNRTLELAYQCVCKLHRHFHLHFKTFPSNNGPYFMKCFKLYVMVKYFKCKLFANTCVVLYLPAFSIIGRYRNLWTLNSISIFVLLVSFYGHHHTIFL